MEKGHPMKVCDEGLLKKVHIENRVSQEISDGKRLPKRVNAKRSSQES